MRLIDADELKANVNNWYDLVNSFGQTNIQLSHKDILAKIDNMPTIEAKSEAEWISKDISDLVYCSKCDFREWYTYAADYNYCPNCGRKMKKEDDNDKI